MVRFFLGIVVMFFFMGKSFSQIDKKNDYRKQINSLKKELKSDSTNKHLNYEISRNYALAYKEDSAFKYLKIYLKYDTTIRFATDPNFFSIVDSPDWEIIVREQISLWNINNQNHPHKDSIEGYIYELLKLGLKDQMYYSHISTIEKKIGRYSPECILLWNIKEKQNIYNINRLDSLVKKYGFPSYSIHSGIATSSAFLVIQHSTTKIQKRYLPILKERANKGEFSWSDLSMLIDRINIGEGKPQVYGTQVKRDEKGNFVLFETIDRENLNKRRSLIGLESIEDYLSRFVDF